MDSVAVDSPAVSPEAGPAVVSVAQVRALKPHVGLAEDRALVDPVVRVMAGAIPAVKDVPAGAAVLEEAITAQATDHQNLAVQLAADVPGLLPEREPVA